MISYDFWWLAPTPTGAGAWYKELMARLAAEGGNMIRGNRAGEESQNN